MVLDSILPCLVALFPTALTSFAVARELHSGPIGSVAAGAFGVLATWHAALAIGTPFNPFWGLVCVVASESNSILQWLKDSRSGAHASRPSMRDAIIVGIVMALACQRFGNSIVSEGIVGILRLPYVRYVLIAAGGLVILSLAGLAVRMGSAQGLSNDAQALKQSILRDYFPTRPRVFEIAERMPQSQVDRLRKDPRFEEAERLYLLAIEADQSGNYGANKRQQQLNLATAYNELSMLKRQREHLDQAIEWAKKAVDHLELIVAQNVDDDRDTLVSLSVAYFRLAESSHVLGQVKTAKEYYERGLRIDEKLGDSEGQDMYKVMLRKLSDGAGATA